MFSYKYFTDCKATIKNIIITCTFAQVFGQCMFQQKTMEPMTVKYSNLQLGAIPWDCMVSCVKMVSFINNGNITEKISQQVSHRRWIWGTHYMQASKHVKKPDIETLGKYHNKSKTGV